HVEDAAKLIEKYDIVPAAVAVQAVPQCNIVFLSGEAMKQNLSGYLAVLMDQNPKAVGGALPADDFYYVPE
ncbi:MAG: ABC transporter substrate-binding protein, partial [Lachnospiraceae bacterium]|nr:ABC transporter substrate-binding protein [Lachnospiraceae bacterium]